MNSPRENNRYLFSRVDPEKEQFLLGWVALKSPNKIISICITSFITLFFCFYFRSRMCTPLNNAYQIVCFAVYTSQASESIPINGAGVRKELW